MTRSTIPVETVRDFANAALAIVIDTDTYTDLEGPSRRWGIIGMVESVLLTTGNYKGYRYLASEYAPEGSPSVLREGFDPTRRCYS
jgi:hypothetical protein